MIWIEEADGHNEFIHRDVTDQPILNAAIQNNVEVIITGDRGFHALDIERPKVMYAADFMAEYMNT